MGFLEDMKAFSERIPELKGTIMTEEATKMSMIVPFFQKLGYDVFNPKEFCPEYICDVGAKKWEKVDYAILINDAPVILVECKWCGENLVDKHVDQLYRYFAFSPAKFGILTNGVVYQFYTDLKETNKMDRTPFLEIDLTNPTDLQEYSLMELKKFSKEVFDPDSIFSAASELKYFNRIKDLLHQEMSDPSECFVRYILEQVYDDEKTPRKTQKMIEKFTPVVKRSLNILINDLVNQKISSVLTPPPPKDPLSAAPDPSEEAEPPQPVSKIVTTEEELESYYIVKGILSEIVNPADIAHRDTESYFGILYQDNNRKPICRMSFTSTRKQILLPDENKNFTRHPLETLNDIYQYKEQLIQITKRYMED